MTDRVGRYLAAVAAQCLAWGADSGIRSSDHFSGRVTAAEIKRLAVRAPAALAACLAADEVRARRDHGRGLSAKVDTRAAIAVYVVTQGKREEREAGARELSMAIAAGAAAADWSEILPAAIRTPRGEIAADPAARCTSDAIEVAAANLFSGDIDKAGLSLWAVSWRIRMPLPVPGYRPPETPVVPKRLFAGWAPDTGPDRLRDYEQLNEEAA